ncbi:hydroxymethylpyrimidine/phosphomethylpyrimidine kinase [mine drainage metagenome]|uniref:Hydroxymethylpyrimidine/phosphomethylpyrimidine kinase n=1 Tax=mine drainage metagenome TaxID=410659 RepID=A0A1J5RYU1_9ZZZZ
MKPIKPYVLSIAGFDPSGGAGILSDIKTIEANGGYGFGVISANTCQNDLAFEKITWIPVDEIIEQINVLQKRFEILYIKIGLIENLEVLYQLVTYLKQKAPTAVIIWDPILKASTGFVFHQSIEKEMLQQVFRNITCITPNIPEACQLFGSNDISERLLAESDDYNIYLKGGHAEKPNATDILFAQQQTYFFTNPRIVKGEKHGSGCVLSAALITQLAMGKELPIAAKNANQYTNHFLLSNETLLGYHSYKIPYETN